MTASVILLLLFGGLLSGFINTLASSGSAVTLPLLVMMGVAAPIANGTNRVPILAGAIAAVYTFHKKGVLDWRGGLKLCVPTIMGTVVGAWLATLLNARQMGVAIVTAVVMALVILLSKAKNLLNSPPGGKLDLGFRTWVVFFIIGVWAGFIVLDSATYMLIALILGVGYDLIGANAIKSLLLLAVSICSLVVFTEKHQINWEMGIILAIGSVVGAWAGSLMATKPWAKVWVFRLLVIVIVAEILHMLHQYHLLSLIPGLNGGGK